MSKKSYCNQYLVARKNITTQKSLMQPILGCNNKYGNEQKMKCNQFLVARLNIAMTILVASGYIATKH
jgi:hypothetical protein